jgi:hypothetical protein
MTGFRPKIQPQEKERQISSNLGERDMKQDTSQTSSFSIRLTVRDMNVEMSETDYNR